MINVQNFIEKYLKVSGNNTSFIDHAGNDVNDPNYDVDDILQEVDADVFDDNKPILYINNVYQDRIKLFPFSSNAQGDGCCASCGLSGITGEFFRHFKSTTALDIPDFADTIETSLNQYLPAKIADSGMIDEVIKLAKNIFCEDKMLRPIDSSFLKYVPLTVLGEPDSIPAKKNINGQKKIAEYTYSMLKNEDGSLSDTTMPDLSRQNNILTDLVLEAIDNNSNLRRTNLNNDTYYTLPFIRKNFAEDLTWLLKQENNVIVNYVPMLLHLHFIMSMTQQVGRLSYNNDVNNSDDAPFNLYYAWEHDIKDNTSSVDNGWESIADKNTLHRLSGYWQTRDILNTILDKENIGSYKELLDLLNEEDFESSGKNKCRTILKMYQVARRRYKGVKQRDLPNILTTELEVDSYEDFIKQLEYLSTRIMDNALAGRFVSKISDMMKMYVLKRKKTHDILQIDENLLILLLAMVTNQETTLLDTAFETIKKRYGIAFSNASKSAISSYLTSLNMLESKSDADEETKYLNVKL